MILDFNWTVVLVACAGLLCFWWFFRKSGPVGLAITCTGCGFLFVAAVFVETPARLVNVTGLLLTLTLIASLLVLSGLVMRARRRIPRYHAPEVIDGRCSVCGRASNVRQTKHGWLCGNCRVDAMVVGKL